MKKWILAALCLLPATVSRAETYKIVSGPEGRLQFVHKISSISIGDLGFITQVLNAGVLQGPATWFNFTGGGCTASVAGGTATINCTGGGGSGDNFGSHKPTTTVEYNGFSFQGSTQGIFGGTTGQATIQVSSFGASNGWQAINVSTGPDQNSIFSLTPSTFQVNVATSILTSRFVGFGSTVMANPANISGFIAPWLRLSNRLDGPQNNNLTGASNVDILFGSKLSNSKMVFQNNLGNLVFGVDSSGNGSVLATNGSLLLSGSGGSTVLGLDGSSNATFLAQIFNGGTTAKPGYSQASQTGSGINVNSAAAGSIDFVNAGVVNGSMRNNGFTFGGSGDRPGATVTIGTVTTKGAGTSNLPMLVVSSNPAIGDQLEVTGTSTTISNQLVCNSTATFNSSTTVNGTLVTNSTTTINFSSATLNLGGWIDFSSGTLDVSSITVAGQTTNVNLFNTTFTAKACDGMAVFYATGTLTASNSQTFTAGTGGLAGINNICAPTAGPIYLTDSTAPGPQLKDLTGLPNSFIIKNQDTANTQGYWIQFWGRPK